MMPLHLLAHACLVLLDISHVHLVRLLLRGVFNVGVVEQLLYSQQNLLDGDVRAPVLLLVKDREADGAARIHIRVKEDRREHALGRLCRVVLCEVEAETKLAALPRRAGLPRDARLPVKQVQPSREGGGGGVPRRSSAHPGCRTRGRHGHRGRRGSRVVGWRSRGRVQRQLRSLSRVLHATDAAAARGDLERLGPEAEWSIFPPCFALLAQARLRQR
ncbi:ubiquitin-conjugating enzyme e2, putative [Leishmania tarentolae]|uniref:Ubiquitin-conjugating enzyme e2, putative n=1 Tax=Leishmania tarentolae TaxID=5689 RepID=A0A640K7D6_LEITA|nr:ubiquitin-conjugating enzyme e2, putative [Leishmania tarentolae]